MKKKFTFPRMGVYTEFFCNLVKDLGGDIITPPKITKETIKLGIKYSPEMICFPYKVCIGNLIQSLESGANAILWPDTQGTCRFTHFSEIQNKVLKDLGYNFDVLLLRRRQIFHDLRQIGNLTYPSLLRKLKKHYGIVKRLEEQHYDFKYESDKVNIGIIGEIYTMHEPIINHNILNLLRKMGANPHLSFKMSDFFRKHVHLDFSKKKEKKESREFLSKDIGGHARESLYNSVYYGQRGFDGVVHLLPLTCMPETTIQPILSLISKKYDLPIYCFPIDENNSEAGFNTRLETFVSILKQKKGLECTV